MAQPLLPRLQRIIQKLGIEDWVPHHEHPGRLLYQLQKALDVYLRFGESQNDFGISENFDPSKLPLVPANTVADRRPPLVKPYFSTVTVDETASASALVDSKHSWLVQAPFDSDDFLACRLFFEFVAEVVEEGIRILVLKDAEYGKSALFLHIKELRMLRALPETIHRELKETVLLQVEYYSNDVEEFAAFQKDYKKVLLDLSKQHRKSTGQTEIKMVLGTTNQVHFVEQVLLSHERLLSKAFVSEHDREWNLKHKLIRPSFIVPLVPLLPENLQDIRGNFEPACESAPRRTSEDAADSGIKLAACEFCSKTNVKLKFCGRCMEVKYCTKQCQQLDWKLHKHTCKGQGS